MSLDRFRIELLCLSIDSMISFVFVHYAIMQSYILTLIKITCSTLLREATPSRMAASRFKYNTTALGRIPFSSVVMVLGFRPGVPGSNPVQILYFCHAFIHYFLCYGLCL